MKQCSAPTVVVAVAATVAACFAAGAAAGRLVYEYMHRRV